jgi:F0F1-type ATP synthase assembly protein I
MGVCYFPPAGDADFGGANDALLPMGAPQSPSLLHVRSRKHTVANLKDNASVAAVGIEMVLAVTIGLLVGQAVDDVLATGPWATVFFVCVGFGAAIKAIARTIEIVQRQLAEEDEAPEARSLQVIRFERRV